MLTLATTNPSKYAPFQRQLERLRIEVQVPPQPLPELQSFSFPDALAAKAKSMAAVFGRPVLVDDAGLVLDAYKPFPGPLTSVVIRSLGAEGIRRLLSGVSNAASMECHLGCWIDGSLRCWSGSVSGRVDTSRPPGDIKMALSDWFIADSPDADRTLLHRARALDAFEAEAFDLHLALSSEAPEVDLGCALPNGYQCPFCLELDGESNNIFSEYVQGRLGSRVVYQDDLFVVMPPLGQFMEGGLLLLTRAHIPSFAYLPPEWFPRLEQLLRAIQELSLARWGISPLVFEHGSAVDQSKGRCCVDHAHLNIFPASVEVHPHLASRMHLKLGSLSGLQRLGRAEFGYLFVQENDNTRYAYDAQYVPSQLVRRIITSQMGLPDRWHWRDYPGCDELLATYHALKGRIQL
jgi:inosine/xanthosine triphosphate pyrophosphatase family protein/diadenosine tetraphosphate (Ap4A) HIT family hydrolase